VATPRDTSGAASAAPFRMLAYVRVSKGDPDSVGLAAQRATIQAEADRRGWSLEWYEDAGISARSLNRPGIQAALARLAAGEADGLVVSRRMKRQETRQG